MEIIPSINAPTFEEVQERIHKVEPYVQWCHLDVTDGVFSTHPTWNNPKDLLQLNTHLNIEVHLMVSNPERAIDAWRAAAIKRMIVHLEATTRIDSIIQKCRDKGQEIGLALRPDTPWELLKPWLDKIDIVQVLGVNPGPSGQEVGDNIFNKILQIHQFCTQRVIEFDGGVNPDTARKAKEAGAEIFVSGSYIFHSADIEKAIKDVRSAVGSSI